MKLRVPFCLMALLILGAPASVWAEDNLIEDFKDQPGKRWQFIADTVMGGVSTGKVAFIREDGDVYARMTGNVSTDNNGGFIQFRMKMSEPLPEVALGLRLVVRGNVQRYFIHLRTGGTFLPWQYYQAGFDVLKGWSEVLLPFEDFKASGAFLKNTPRPKDVHSVGIVAFGRDHKVEIDVREMSYY
jgi:hypothetical protein